ncbi:AAA family ATPase [Enhygromyxa salina]|uniref:AAA family ATPase n=1 Tax=Enhygromyxa salina TaxID=215803 RepID=UPI000D0867B2
MEDERLWLPASKLAIIDELASAVEGREHAVLVGEPGGGKTCSLRGLRQRLPETEFRLTYCHNATLGRRDFYRQLCIALGLSPKATAAAVFHSVSTHIEELGRERVHPVLLLDETHLLHPQVLDHLHVLANFHWDRKPLLSLVLVGLPELWNQLSRRKNRSLWSRIHCRLSLEAPTVADSTEYVEYRLRQVGASKLLLGAGALTILHEATRGQLRDIDRVATNSLRLAARRKQSVVDRELLEYVLEREQQAGLST